MKTKKGLRVITYLQPGEKIKVIKTDAHYRLGYPLELDVVDGQILTGATPVTWCCITQEWR